MKITKSAVIFFVILTIAITVFIKFIYPTKRVISYQRISGPEATIPIQKNLNGTESVDSVAIAEIWQQYVSAEEFENPDFEMLNEWYAKNGSKLYSRYEYCHPGASCGNKSTRIINTSSVDSFTILYGKYAKDKEAVYFQGIRITGADPDSFTVLGEEVGKDIEKVFYKTNPFLLKVDVETFGMVSPSIGYDKEYSYYINTVEHGGSEKDNSSLIEDLSPLGLEVIDGMLVKNKYGTYSVESVGLNNTKAVKI